MRVSSNVMFVISTGLLAIALAFCTAASTYADSPVTYAVGIVDVDADGTVSVCVTDSRDPDRRCKEGDVLFPSNGRGLLQSGQIVPGDIVDLKIVYDRGHRTRGHVTVLK